MTWGCGFSCFIVSSSAIKSILSDSAALPGDKTSWDYEGAIATLNWCLPVPLWTGDCITVQRDCRLITPNMTSIISMLVSFSAISFCLSSCKAVLHSYIPVVQQNVGQRDGLILKHTGYGCNGKVYLIKISCKSSLIRCRSQIYNTVKHYHVAESRKT